MKLSNTPGFKTCALTNNWIDDTRNQEDQFKGFLVNHFDLVLESCKLGMRKPDPRIYRLACEQLQMDPGEVRTFLIASNQSFTFGFLSHSLEKNICPTKSGMESLGSRLPFWSLHCLASFRLLPAFVVQHVTKIYAASSEGSVAM